jgi:hypothetical protein
MERGGRWMHRRNKQNVKYVTKLLFPVSQCESRMAFISRLRWLINMLKNLNARGRKWAVAHTTFVEVYSIIHPSIVQT